MRTTILSDDEAKVLEERDERVRNKIVARLRDIRLEKEELRQRLEDLDKAGRHILRAVDNERWFELRGLLSASEVESLCGISPKDLLGDD